ncbi:phage/plasmid primase, P4 family [Desulfovibrio sp. OttesenSCG-928-C06]|nr:phage/plasmid primase, P4 family [Desulfovibrio sp. OttesenSCG-928-C06]
MPNSTPTPEELAAMRQSVAERAKERAPAVAAPAAPVQLSERQILDCEEENYLGDAKIYMHLHRGKVMYVHLYEKWYRWAGHHWEADINAAYTLSLVEEVAQEYMRAAGIYSRLASPEHNPGQDEALYRSNAKKCEALMSRAKRCRGTTRGKVLEYVNSGPDTMAILGDELDSNPWLLCFANGVLDLRTLDFRPGRPDDYITLSSPTEWLGLDADATPFVDFLRHILSDNDDQLGFMLRFLGMALLGEQRSHAFLVLFGEGGRNGKDTLMSILLYALGSRLMSTVAPEIFMEQRYMPDTSKGNPALMDMRGKRIIYASESSKRHRFSSETIKRYTGGGKMEARGLHENHMSRWEMTHTLILLTNELPAAPPEDEAFWLRLYGVELKRRYLDEPDPNKDNEFKVDPELKHKMQSCAPGIVAALVKGFQDYLKQGLNPPDEIRAFKAAYRKAEDKVGQFMDDCCCNFEPGPNAGDEIPSSFWVRTSRLYDCFAFWHEREISRKVPSSKFFHEAMRKKDFAKHKSNGVEYYRGFAISLETEKAWEEWQNTRSGKKDREF